MIFFHFHFVELFFDFEYEHIQTHPKIKLHRRTGKARDTETQITQWIYHFIYQLTRFHRTQQSIDETFRNGRNRIFQMKAKAKLNFPNMNWVSSGVHVSACENKVTAQNVKLYVFKAV